MSEMLDHLQSESSLRTRYESKVRSQEQEINSLLACIDKLRMELLKFTTKEQRPVKFEEFDKLMQNYKGNTGLLRKLEEEHKVGLRKIIMDLQMDRIRVVTELDVLDKKMKDLTERLTKMEAGSLKTANESSGSDDDSNRKSFDYGFNVNKM